jgi:GH24 family phage-related lysozyme (muramidase)
MSKLTGLVSPGKEKAYFFTGSDYVRYDVAADAVDEGYPQPIAGAWSGLFDDVDAAIEWPDGNAYFFKGGQYAKYDMTADRVADEYPKDIDGNWPGVWTDGVDAAVLWPGGESVYFFKGDEYVKYDVASDAAAEGYPMKIADSWPGVFESGIDAVLAWPTGDVFFFKGDEYVKYDVASDKAYDDYPRAITAGWTGLPIGAAVATTTGTTTTTGGATTTTTTTGGTGSGRTVRDAFVPFTTGFEARVAWMYLDIKGMVTVGVGNLIDTEGGAAALPFVHKSDDSPASQDEIRAEWRAVKADTALAQKGHHAAEKVTSLKLTEAAMDDLVRKQYDANEAEMRRHFPDWDQFPADARMGLHSMAWALGANLPKRFPNFSTAVRAQDWTTAAAQCHIDETGNAGVKPRNVANVALFTNAATVKANGLDVNTLYYPGKP